MNERQIFSQHPGKDYKTGPSWPTLFATMLATVLCIAGERSALADQDGYVFAHSATASFYTPDPPWNYNGAGSLNTVSHFMPGQYVVTMTGLLAAHPLADLGNVQVTATGLGSDYCKVSAVLNFGIGSPIVYVNCFDSAGLPADSTFTVGYFDNQTWPWPGIDAAYLLADQPTVSGPYVPASSFNSTGLVNSVLRDGVGQYRGILTGMTNLGATVLVTGAGPGNERCKVQSWAMDEVRVRCHDPAGNLVDAPFSLSYTYGTPPAGPGGCEGAFFGAYAWANEPITASYLAPEPYQCIGAGGCFGSTIQIFHLVPVGSYRVFIPGLAADNKTIPLVTAYGVGSEHCKVQNWKPAFGGGVDVVVQCYDTAGSLIDTPFTITYQTDDPLVC